MKTKFLSSFIIFFMYISSLFSQELCTLEIIDRQDYPVYFAEVIIKKDSSVLIHDIADEDGKIFFKCIPQGKYTIKIKSLNKIMDSTIQIMENNHHVKVIFDPTIELEEVAIVAKRSYFKHRNGSLIVDVGGKNNLGNNADQILKNSPGIELIGDNLSYLGKPVKIEINGKKSHLSGNQIINLLQNQGYQTIEKIELVSNPGARYSSNFSGGVINIITKNENEGLKAFINSSYNQRDVFSSFSPGVSINYHKNKLIFYSDLSYSQGKRRESSKRTHFIENDNQSILERNVNDYKNKGFSYVAGVDWLASKKTVVGLDFQGYTNKIDGYKYGDSKILNNNQLDSIYTLDDNRKELGSLMNLNLNVKTEIDTLKSYLNFDVDFGTQSGDMSNNQYSESYLVNNTLLSDRIIKQEVNTNNYFYSLSGELKKHFKNVVLEAGVKYNFTSIKQDLDEMSPFIPNPTGSYENELNYKEHIMAFFSEISGAFKKFRYTLGLRAENTFYKGYALDEDSDIKKNYFNIFPTVKIDRSINRHYLSFSFKRNILRPRFNQLIPFKRYTGNFSYYTGNPNLISYFPYSYDLYYSYNNSLWTNISYSHASNRILEMDRLLPNSNITEGLKVNNGSYKRLYAGIGYNSKVTKWLRIASSASLSHGNEKFRSSLPSNAVEQIDYTAHTLWFSPTFYFNKFQFVPNFHYSSDVYYGVSKNLNYWFLDAYLSYYFWDNNAIVSFTARDIFKTAVTKRISNYGNIHLTSENDWGSRQFILKFQLFLGNKKTQSKRRRNLGNQKTIRRLN